MKQSTSMIPISAESIVLLKKSVIVGAFINALPPRELNLHGSSVEFFFENGESCSIDGMIIDVAPKVEATTLCIGKTMKLEAWQNEIEKGTLLPTIETTDLLDVWKRKGGLDQFLVGPREIQFFKRVSHANRCLVEDTSKFEAICLFSSVLTLQCLLLYSSENSPGDVVVGECTELRDFNNLVRWELLPQNKII